MELTLMSARCPQCGYSAELLTETQFHTCGQCGAAYRVYGGRGVPEQYLRHDRDDVLAWGALLGLLDSEARQLPDRPGNVHFAYYPFWCADLQDGGIRLKPAAPLPDGFPLPTAAPVGALDFIRPPQSFPQASITPETAFAGTGEVEKLRLLQLPLYLISYQVAGAEHKATVSGSLWQAYANTLPEEAGIHLPLRRVKFLGAYLAILLAAGFLAPDYLWRAAAFAVILLCAWGLERSASGKR
jgi:ribosomal protein S27AE